MSRPPRPPRRGLRTVVLILGCLMVLGGCTQQRQVPDSYGDTTKNNFQEGCVEALTVQAGDADADGFTEGDIGEAQPLSADRASDVCSCSYEGISNPDTGIPFEEFKTLNDELEENAGPLPENIQTIVDGCEESTAG